MKRKLIDLKDSTFRVLSVNAEALGTNLKQYIESLLDEKAQILEDSCAFEYNFSMSREPSDRELAAIMASAAKVAEQKNKTAISNLFVGLKESISGI